MCGNISKLIKLKLWRFFIFVSVAKNANKQIVHQLNSPAHFLCDINLMVHIISSSRQLVMLFFQVSSPELRAIL